MRRPLLLGGLGTVVAAVVVPQFVSGSSLDAVAVALALAGPAAGAALAAAAGRPLIAASALGGIGAYVSGLASLHGLPVPAAIVFGGAAATVAGAAVGVAGARLDSVGFLLATALVAVGLGAGIQALPAITGAQSGLGPLPALSVPLANGRAAVLTPLGDFHVALAVEALLIALAMALRRRGPGPRWRAIGSDRARAAASGLRPLVGEILVLAVAGTLAGVSGALSAHVSRVATPSSFALDMGALPLLAALAAGRRPLGAALVAVATGLLGQVLLPDLGWQGPPSAQSVALGVLGVAALLTLTPRRRSHQVLDPSVIDVASPWPIAELGLVGAPLTVAALTRRSRDGGLLVDAPALAVSVGRVHGVVGANGAGKSTLLRAIVATAPQPEGSRIALLLQDGGGFAACTVLETLRLAAGPGRAPADAASIAAAWAGRLGFIASPDRLCGELSSGQRRLVDLARVLLGRPNVLLCDEPLAGLDDQHRAAVVACLTAAAEAGLTVVIAEHDRAAVAVLATTVTELYRADLSPSLVAAPIS